MEHTTKTLEEWTKEKETADWLVAATKAAMRWPVGKELTEGEFDAAIEATGELRMLPSAPTKES